MFNQIVLRPTFLQWFILMITLAVVAFYGWLDGFFMRIYLLDKSFVSFVILGVVLLTMIHCGWIAWWMNTNNVYKMQNRLSWLNEAISISPLVGIIGTVVGFLIQSPTLVSGSAGLAPLSTSLFSTLFGVGGAIILRITRFILHSGIQRLYSDDEAVNETGA